MILNIYYFLFELIRCIFDHLIHPNTDGRIDRTTQQKLSLLDRMIVFHWIYLTVPYLMAIACIFDAQAYYHIMEHPKKDLLGCHMCLWLRFLCLVLLLGAIGLRLFLGLVLCRLFLCTAAGLLTWRASLSTCPALVEGASSCVLFCSWSSTGKKACGSSVFLFFLGLCLCCGGFLVSSTRLAILCHLYSHESCGFRNVNALAEQSGTWHVTQPFVVVYLPSWRSNWKQSAHLAPFELYSLALEWLYSLDNLIFWQSPLVTKSCALPCLRPSTILWKFISCSLLRARSMGKSAKSGPGSVWV